MKKFQFSLDTVLSYKQQIQDSLQTEHAEILARVRSQENVLDELLARYRAYCVEYQERCGAGLPITDVLVYQSGLRAMEREIQKESAYLAELRQQEEKKRMEVIVAKRDTASIEKLREKKLQDYQKALDKSNELFIEEFVSLGRVREAADRKSVV